MYLRRSLGAAVLVGLALSVLSCSGPAPSSSDKPRAEEPERVYLVQVHSTKDKAEADQVVGRALEWWTEREDALPPRYSATSQDSPVMVAWKPPLYRVRMGPFASRAQAQAALDIAQSSFPDAFIAPSNPSRR